ncbi:MAG: succinylglutamate desuccinylase, partial [Candidatus Cloacimonadia bacterium]
EMYGIDIGLEESPQNLRGLSHREWGDNTDTNAVLFEVSNPAQGRMRGQSSEELIVTGKDKFYVDAAERRQLFVPYDEDGYPIKLRVARHIATFKEFISSWNMLYPDKTIEIEGIPEYQDILDNGLGDYL